MKSTMKSILFAGILAMSASSMFAAQTSNSWAEQWYRAKFGRPSPTEQARIDAVRQPSAAPVQAVAVTQARHGNAWLEQWYQTKHGRPTPREEARIRETNLGRDLVMTSKAETPVDTRFECWYRAKYGRPSPLQEAR